MGTIRAYLNWSSAYTFAQYGARPQPGPPPTYAELVTFSTTGAREVYTRQDAQAGRDEQPSLRQVDDAEGQLPDVVGRNWIVRGNDTSVDTRAINNRQHAVIAPTPPAAQGTTTPNTAAPKITCKVHLLVSGETTTYTVDAGTYRGPVRVNFYGEKDDGSRAARPFHTFDLTVRSRLETKVFPVADDQPVGGTGAGVPPNTCQAIAG